MGRTARSARLVTGVVLVAAVCAGALLAPWIGSSDPRQGDIATRLKPPGFPGHPLGTDQLGRDLLSRILFGTRLSLLTSVATVAITIVLGTWSGVVAGYYGGLVDRLVGGVVDIQMAFPFLLMAVALAAGAWGVAGAEWARCFGHGTPICIGRLL
jgi:peptide/nickel transport system permease protein